ncbi:unnamed protein product [Allacma fusca]|uniref:Uncharacterized protein n=1 Tax=Allacma fusca TaxID=39272 RepID=A0A8J2K8S0_9HEXA|nr:unnamed protein product [Allacma fusca]
MRAVTCFAFVFVACLAELIPMGSGTAYKYFRSIGPERRLSKLGVREQNIPDKRGADPHDYKAKAERGFFIRQAVIGGFNTNTGYYSAYLPTLDTAPLLGSLNGFQEPIFPGVVDESEVVVESIEEEIIPVQPDGVLIPSTPADDVPIITPGVNSGTINTPIAAELDDLESPIIPNEPEELDFP